MADVVSLAEWRERRTAEEHVRALVLFECASQLARRGHPDLVALVSRVFGADFIEARVAEAAAPRPEPARRRAAQALRPVRKAP